MARIIGEPKQFKNAGMDTDSAIEKIDRVDIVEAWNLIVTGNVMGEDGDGSNLASTEEVLGYTLPSGLNKGMGGVSFLDIRKGYVLIYNSFGNHQLVELDYDANTKNLLFTDLIDSAGIPVLNFHPRDYIMDIKMADGNILIFTDSQNEIFSVNISRLKGDGYSPVNYNDFRLIKAQPLKVPTLKYGDDAGRVVNAIKNKLFQVNSQFYYLDNEPSAFSTWSKRATPTKEATTSIGEDVTKNNNLTATVDIGTNRVNEIRIGGRYSLYDWFLIKTVSRDYVLTITDTEIDIPNEILEAYNPTDNTYSFVFYNDGSYPNIDPTETDHEYDRVPRKAETLELLEQNILAVAGITEGYDRPVVPVSFTTTNYDPKLEEGSSDADPFRVATMYDTDPAGHTHKRKIWVGFNGIAKTGDLITIIVKDFRNATVTKTYTYTVESDYNNNTLAALQKMAVTMGYQGIGAVAYSTAGTSQQKISEYMLTWMDFEYYSAQNGYAKVTNASVGSGILSSISALKSNSAYQLALQIYDEYGRPFPLITGKEYIQKTSSYAQSKGLTPIINWQILNVTPPALAASYQWLLSYNTTHQTTLYINGKYVSSDGQYITLYINPLRVFNERNKSSVLNYQYSEGDRVTFMYYDNAGTPVYFDNPYIDVQVVAFDIVPDTVPDPDVINYVLKVALNPNIVIADITGKNIYMEIYTPKKRVITEGDTTTYLTNLFYEVGEQFPVINGQFSVLEGTITDGDVYFQTRDYVSAIDETTYSTYLAEDFNFSAVYESMYTSYGRGWLYNDRDGIKIRKASIRWSDKFVIDSRTNMLNRFYGERIYGDGDGETSSVYGWIRKIRQMNNILFVYQEIKVGRIPVFNTIVEDQVGQQQAFLSDRIFNKIRYSDSGNYGMGNARESYSESPSGFMYIIDPNNSVPMRNGFSDGLTDISRKMSKFFKGFIQQAKKDGRDVVSWYDPYSNHLVLSAQVANDSVIQIPISVSSMLYQDDYIVNKTDITITQQPTKAVVAFIDNEWVITPNEGTTGSDSFKISFVVEGNPIEKNVCFTITAGETAPLPFFFNDVINAEVSTLYTSNFILVTNMTNPLPVSVVGGEYSFDGITWTTTAGLVEPDTNIQVRRLSSASTSTLVSVVLTVGTYSDSFDITTKSDPDPEPFTFTPIENAEISTLYQSPNQIQVLGIDVPISISIVEGEYEKNGSGIWTSLEGTVVLNDLVRVRRTSSPLYATVVSTELNLNGVLGYFNITTKEEPSVGNEFRSSEYRRNDCNPGTETGTVVVTSVEPNTYFAETVELANAEADAYIASVGQSNANSQGYCLLNNTNSIALVDMYNDGNLDVGVYIDTPGVAESLNMAYTGNNFYLPTDPAATAFLLASDHIDDFTNKRRFAINIGKLIGMYPDSVAIPKFIFKIRGRSTSAGIKNGAYSLKDPNMTLIMTGSPGTYMCGAVPSGGPAPTGWSAPCPAGGDGTIGIGIGDVILTFEYDRAANTFLQV